jgi:hypothetical protein
MVSKIPNSLSVLVWYIKENGGGGDLISSDVVESWQPVIFACYCPFLAVYFSMSKNIM